MLIVMVYYSKRGKKCIRHSIEASGAGFQNSQRTWVISESTVLPPAVSYSSMCAVLVLRGACLRASQRFLIGGQS